MASKYEVDGTDLIIRNLEREDEGSYLCKAVQNVVNEEGVIKYSDFKDFIINLKIERKIPFHISLSWKFAHYNSTSLNHKSIFNQNANAIKLMNT